jgi:uncharacterized protein YsxB (DUF464 family)
MTRTWQEYGSTIVCSSIAAIVAGILVIGWFS